MLTDRDLAILTLVARYYTLTRAQVNRLAFPGDRDGRVTRKRLAALLAAGMLNRTHMQVVNPAMGAPAPVFYPSRKGVEWLAAHADDRAYLATCTQTPNWQHLYHWVAVADTHIMLDAAAAATPGVAVAGWLGEWSVANPDEKLPERRYALYTRLDDKLVCVPDAAFLLEKGGHRKVYYLEQDRDTTKLADRVASQKCNGYAALADRGLHARHFPAATVGSFNVLMVAPTARRRDALRKAMAPKPGAALWKFASLDELAAETFLSGPVWHPCACDPGPLLNPN